MKFITQLKTGEFNQRVTALSVSRFISALSALLVLWILARFVLDPIALSHYRKLWPFYALFGPVFLSAVLNTAYLNGSRHEFARFALGQALRLLAIGALFLGVSSYVLAAPIAVYLNVPELQPAYERFALYSFFALLGGFAEPLFVISKRTDRLPWFIFSVTLGDMLAILLPFIWTQDLLQVLFWMTLAQVVRLPVLLVLYRVWSRALPVSEKRHPFEWKSIQYLLSMAFIALAGLGAVEINRFIVGSRLDDFAFILYDLGARKIPFITIITTSISSAIVATYAHQVQQGAWAEVSQKVQASTERLFRGLLPVLTVLAVGAPSIVTLVFGPLYREAAPVFFWFTLALFSNIVFPQSLLQASGRSWVIVWTSVIETLVNITLSLFLIDLLGIEGVAMAVALSHWLYTLILLGYCRLAFQLPLSTFFPRVPSLWYLAAILLLAGWSYGVAYHLYGYPGFEDSLWMLPVMLAAMAVAFFSHKAYPRAPREKNAS